LILKVFSGNAAASLEVETGSGGDQILERRHEKLSGRQDFENEFRRSSNVEDPNGAFER